jgi:hypothetical protein
VALGPVGFYYRVDTICSGCAKRHSSRGARDKCPNLMTAFRKNTARHNQARPIIDEAREEKITSLEAAERHAAYLQRARAMHKEEYCSRAQFGVCSGTCNRAHINYTWPAPAAAPAGPPPAANVGPSSS